MSDTGQNEGGRHGKTDFNTITCKLVAFIMVHKVKNPNWQTIWFLETSGELNSQPPKQI